MTVLKEAMVPEASRQPAPGANYVGGRPSKWIVALRIEKDEDDGAYLFCCDEAGEVVADTWHETLDEALALAKTDFDVQPDDWTSVEDER